MMLIDGKLLGEIRTDLNYKKVDMARHLGVTLTALSNWENGTSNPTPVNQKEIVRYIQDWGYRGPTIIDIT